MYVSICTAVLVRGWVRGAGWVRLLRSCIITSLSIIQCRREVYPTRQENGMPRSRRVHSNSVQPYSFAYSQQIGIMVVEDEIRLLVAERGVAERERGELREQQQEEHNMHMYHM